MDDEFYFEETEGLFWNLATRRGIGDSRPSDHDRTEVIWSRGRRGEPAGSNSARHGGQPWAAAKSSPVPMVPVILATLIETEYA